MKFRGDLFIDDLLQVIQKSIQGIVKLRKNKKSTCLIMYCEIFLIYQRESYKVFTNLLKSHNFLFVTEMISDRQLWTTNRFDLFCFHTVYLISKPLFQILTI